MRSFMLDYINDIVYQSPFMGTDDQKKRITDTIMVIYADVHLRTWHDLDYLLDVVHFHRECHNYGILK
jgi:hypothetical protein